MKLYMNIIFITHAKTELVFSFRKFWNVHLKIHRRYFTEKIKKVSKPEILFCKCFCETQGKASQAGINYMLTSGS